MERTEPTFVPEWLKNSGGSSTTSHQSSLHTDEQGSSKPVRNKTLLNNTENDLGRPSVSDRTTSSYFRRSSLGNGSTHLRSYSSFGRNHRGDNRDWDKDIYEFRNKEKSENNRHRDYSDPLDNILPNRFEKDGLRRSHSSVSGRRGDSWPRKVVSDLSIANKTSHSNGISNVKTSFERDFPSLGADEKLLDSDIGRVPSPGLSSAIQNLPTGNSAVIGGDGWTSALAEVPVIVGSNGNSSSSVSVSVSSATTGGRNMAETLAHGPPRAQTAPQLTVGTQRLEELAVKQSRQLIPMTPSMPKALACDKPKLKIGQSQVQSVLHPHTPRPVSVKSDVSKPSKLLVLKPGPARERNGVPPTTTKETLSPTAGGKLPNSPLAKPPAMEKRPSSQAQSRNNFFNLMRKKSLISNSCVAPVSTSGDPPSLPPDSVVVKSDSAAVDGGKNRHSGGGDVILYSEEEEARFLRSLGWEETAEEEEGLTEEEISSFYRNYLNVKPTSKILKTREVKVLMEESKVDS